MRRSIVEQFLPIDEWHEIDVEPHPGAKIVQSGLRGSKAECLYGATEHRRAAGETDERKIEDAGHVRELVSAAAEGRVLITYEELEELLGHVPSAHFNALEGLNEFSARALVVYGRPLPDPRDVVDKARAIFCDGEPIRAIGGVWYPKRSIAYRGLPRFGISEYHPDLRVEDIRWMTCEGEVLQAIARARYVRHPVLVLILNQIPLPLRLTRVVPPERLDPQWEEFERTQVVPLSHRELARLWPRVWRDGRSADRWIRANKAEWADKNAAFVITYRREGARGRASKALVAGTGAIAQLGAVKEWDLAEDTDRERQQNDLAMCVREARDLIAREPPLDEDLSGVAFELGSAWLDPEEVAILISGSPPRSYVRGLSMENILR